MKDVDLMEFNAFCHELEEKRNIVKNVLAEFSTKFSFYLNKDKCEQADYEAFCQVREDYLSWIAVLASLYNKTFAEKTPKPTFEEFLQLNTYSVEVEFFEDEIVSVK